MVLMLMSVFGIHDYDVDTDHDNDDDHQNSEDPSGSVRDITHHLIHDSKTATPVP